jgi:hypothetical protein
MDWDGRRGGERVEVCGRRMEEDSSMEEDPSMETDRRRLGLMEREAGG